MTNEATDSAEEAVTATTDSYGGPVSEEQLAEVYLPEGQHEVHGAEGSKATDDLK